MRGAEFNRRARPINMLNVRISISMVIHLPRQHIVPRSNTFNCILCARECRAAKRPIRTQFISMNVNFPISRYVMYSNELTSNRTSSICLDSALSIFLYSSFANYTFSVGFTKQHQSLLR